MSDFPLTKEQFAEWLDTRDDREEVGISWMPRQCPLATACKYTKHIDVSIGSDNWMEGQSEVKQSLPYWAYQFVRKIDDAFPKLSVIHVAEAREILADIRS